MFTVFMFMAVVAPGGARGGYSSPVGGNFGFLSEELWQNDVRIFQPFQPPCRKLKPLCRKICGATPGEWNVIFHSIFELPNDFKHQFMTSFY